MIHFNRHQTVKRETLEQLEFDTDYYLLEICTFNFQLLHLRINLLYISGLLVLKASDKFSYTV